MPWKLKKLTEEQISACATEYARGLSIATCARSVGVSRQALWSVFKHRGVPMRSNLRFGSENHFHRLNSEADDLAHNRVENALRRGTLANPGRCETCGAENVFADGRSGIQAHHDDYNKPLSVRWLCQPCHHEWHRHNVAIAKR